MGGVESVLTQHREREEEGGEGQGLKVRPTTSRAKFEVR